MAILPSRLTAENGAKALLMGEFYETREVDNLAYCDCEECAYCIAREGEPETIIEKIPVSWDTIKAIYAKIVEHYGVSYHSKPE